MRKILRNITLAAIIWLYSAGCDEHKPKLHKELTGSAYDVTQYLKWRGISYSHWYRDKDFDGDGINDVYVKPEYRRDIIYYTMSKDTQPANNAEIHWYLLIREK